jgi:Glycosyl hydrolase family 9
LLLGSSVRAAGGSQPWTPMVRARATAWKSDSCRSIASGGVVSAVVRGGSAGEPAAGAGQPGRLSPGAADSGNARYRRETPAVLHRPGPWRHVLDFTTAGVHGPDMRIEVDGHRSHPFAVGTDAYGRLARDALGVFRLLRSGAPLGDDVPAGYARPAGHAGHPPNRGDTAVTAWTGPDAERLYPGWRCPGTFDVSGGWYDAGDYGKYVTSGSIAVWQLLSTLDLLPTRPTAWSTGRAAVAPAVRTDRWLGLGLQRAHPQQPRRPRRRPPPHRQPSVCQRRSRRHGLPAGPQRPRAELRHPATAPTTAVLVVAVIADSPI